MVTDTLPIGTGAQTETRTDTDRRMDPRGPIRANDGQGGGADGDGHLFPATFSS